MFILFYKMIDRSQIALRIISPQDYGGIKKVVVGLAEAELGGDKDGLSGQVESEYASWAERAIILTAKSKKESGGNRAYAEIMEPAEFDSYEDVILNALQTPGVIRFSTRQFSGPTPQGPWMNAIPSEFYQDGQNDTPNMMMVDAVAETAGENGFLYVHFPLSRSGDINDPPEKSVNNEIGFMQIGRRVYSKNVSIPVSSLHNFSVDTIEYKLNPNARMVNALLVPDLS